MCAVISAAADRHSARRIAGANWAFRAAFERGATAHFRAIATCLTERQAPTAAVDLAWAAIDEEARHAELCGELADWLGAEVPPAIPVGGSAVGLVDVVAMCCVTETLSAALLGAMRDAAGPRRVRSVLHEVLRDEVRHSRIGWAVLAAGVSPAERAQLAAAIPGVLRDTVSQELFTPGDSGVERVDARPLGVLTRSERRAIFATTMRQVVFPGLERFDVDVVAGRAWLEDRVGSA